MKIEFHPKKPQPEMFKRKIISNRVKLFDISKGVKKGETQSHDIYYCPFCDKERGKPDKKGKFYFDKTLKIGYCFYCESVGVLDIKNKDISDYELEMMISIFISRSKKLSNTSNFNKQVLDISKIFDPLDDVAKKYLVSRLPFYDELYDLLPMYSSENGVVFPVYYENKCVSYIIRNYVNMPKYFIGSNIKYFYSPNNIFTSGNRVKEVTLVEGVFDCLGAILNGYSNPVAIFGKTITSFQISILRSLCPQKINIYLDDMSLSWKLLHKIKREFPLVDSFKVIKSYGDDPEEIYINYLSNNLISDDEKILNFNKALKEIEHGNSKLR